MQMVQLQELTTTLAFCRGYVKDEDKEKCDDAGKLVRYFQSLNQ